MHGREWETAILNPDTSEKALESDQEEYSDAYDIIYQLFVVTGKDLQEQLERVKARYGFDDERATDFITLKYAMKEELQYKGMNRRKLIEVSDYFTKARLVEVGAKHGLTEEAVLALLPAMAMKLTAHEVKFTVSMFKQGFFAKPQQFHDALSEIDNKYQKRFGL